MCDNRTTAASAPPGQQIRRLREERGWSLAELARRAGTSAPALHRYESGWDRFEMATLRKIASALGARLDVRLVPAAGSRAGPRQSNKRRLLRILSPLFWDRRLTARLLDDHPEWVLGRVLMFGDREQVAAARLYYGDEAIRRAVARRGIDARTRNYWEVILGGTRRASECHRR